MRNSRYVMIFAWQTPIKQGTQPRLPSQTKSPQIQPLNPGAAHRAHAVQEQPKRPECLT